MYKIHIQVKDKTKDIFIYPYTFNTYKEAEDELLKIKEQDTESGWIDDYDYTIVSEN